MKRHFLALLLSLTMIISLLPVTAMAEDEQEDELVTREAKTPVEPATSGDCGTTRHDGERPCHVELQQQHGRADDLR